MSGQKPSYDRCKEAADKLARDLERSGMSREAAEKKAREVARKTDAKQGR